MTAKPHLRGPRATSSDPRVRTPEQVHSDLGHYVAPGRAAMHPTGYGLVYVGYDGAVHFDFTRDAVAITSADVHGRFGASASYPGDPDYPRGLVDA